MPKPNPVPHREAAYLIPHLLQYVRHLTSCRAEAKMSLYCTCDLSELVREVLAWQSGETEDIDDGIPPWEREEDGS